MLGSFVVIEIEELGNNLVHVDWLLYHANSSIEHQFSDGLTVKQKDRDCALLVRCIGGILRKLTCRDKHAVVVLALDGAAKFVDVRPTYWNIVLPFLSLKRRLDADGTLTEVTVPVY